MFFRVGEKVVMSEDALSNYGEKWRGKILIITHVATKYMSSKEFFSKGQPQGYHPGFNGGSGPLYDLAESGSKGLPMSLYGWELALAPKRRR